MCGICGIVAQRLLAEQFVPFLGRMADSMRHRGPDGMKIALTDVGAFCHLRLAIVDVEGGSQPIYNENGSIGVVFNGEIYNYRDLRKFLESKGHTFKTKTDTEVIVHLFEQCGEKSFEKLLGMFAFALWTPTQVYLVRDQIGIKPLYYYTRDKEVLFCSEIKGLLTAPGLDLSFDPEGVSQYLTFRYCPGKNTVFSHIKRLPAAHYMKIENGRSEIHRYFSLTEDMARRPIEEGDEGLLNSMLEVVKSHLMGEVPIGLTLSGGIDSSSIAYFINRLGATLETYNIGFPSVNEFPYSEAVARHFGLNHTIVEMNPNELIGYLPKYIQAIDEPIADAACLPLYKLCETMKKKVTVVLSGEGGDEIFAGYPQYRQVTDAFSANSSSAFEYFLEKSFYFVNNEGHVISVDRRNFPHQNSFVGTLLTAMLLYDLHTWVPENLMMKADKVLMFHSLEGRFPFLDLRVMRAAFALQDDQKLHPSGESKWALKRLMSGPLPEAVLRRRKMGFTVPIGELLWQCRDTVCDVIESVSDLDSILDRKRLRKTVASYYSGAQDNSLLVWTIFVLYFWLHHYFGPGRKAQTCQTQIDERPLCAVEI